MCTCFFCFVFFFTSVLKLFQALSFTNVSQKYKLCDMNDVPLGWLCSKDSTFSCEGYQ